MVTDLPWGTHPPLCLDPPGQGPQRLRAHGRISLQVKDPARLLPAIPRAAADPAQERRALAEGLRGAIVAELEQLLVEEPPPPPPPPPRWLTLAARLGQRLAPVLEPLGLLVTDLTIAGLAGEEEPPPPPVQSGDGERWLHVLQNGEPSAALSLADVAALRWRGDLQPDSWIWHADLDDWQPASSLPELAPLFQAPPPPPPPPA